ncbi:hypothetical protein GLOIN_2v1768893 [Rhizophagus irregularis DAOM 181602=DAOM 197198]|uniref:Uncharacterized protein n=1 Tax=Rhizophagus irregularis (strain DAOM 181602 / DAOM 197198 / MUCL 43194) TaxID=747089 RepID=A0A2P4QFW0_RHIID|nr:hypothetical protein GLOIN_2v1768893 [Rhizophagus irregularis DAOM 181602=DAOM 197198]POG76514.1 hypothetical protein GLOIN_2v1768893 [Rhizophagus irregularis DAOM 181602=DAOM 197198]|eukprot:XP_025183380.1 hypothetical protein GLOIN_2v1768893 [Rhizophagus irregularis DAOM 181602=DAOM 197198]
MSEPSNIFKKVFKKISNRNNRNTGTENFNEESQVIRAQQGYTQFPPLPGLPSDCAFSFDNVGGFQPHQNLNNAIAAVGAYLNSPNGIWAKHTPLIPDLGRVYQIEVPRKGIPAFLELTKPEFTNSRTGIPASWNKYLDTWRRKVRLEKAGKSIEKLKDSERYQREISNNAINQRTEIEEERNKLAKEIILCLT